MSPLLQVLAHFLDSIEWSWELVDEDGSVLGCSVSGESGRWNCFGQAHDERQQMVFYSLCPVVCPEDRRAAMAELIARVNYGMVLGNFELDYEDGEVRFKTSIDVEDLGFTADGCRQLVFPNCLMMDRYLPAISAVAYSGIEPEGAVAMLELEPDELFN
jgi:hypothetical protein